MEVNHEVVRLLTSMDPQMQIKSHNGKLSKSEVVGPRLFCVRIRHLPYRDECNCGSNTPIRTNTPDNARHLSLL